jgi:hypothetical protein
MTSFFFKIEDDLNFFGPEKSSDLVEGSTVGYLSGYLLHRSLCYLLKKELFINNDSDNSVLKKCQANKESCNTK